MDIIRTRRELLLEGLRAAGVVAAAGLLGPEAILAQEAKKKKGGKGKGRRAQQAAPAGATGTPDPTFPPTVVTDGFRIGACDWTLRLGSNPEALDLAKKLGLDGLQVAVGGPDNFPVFEPGIQKIYQEKMRATGMRVSTLGLSVYNSRPYFEEPKAQEWMAKTIDACAPMGATGILVAFFGKGDLRTDPKNIETTIARLKEMAPKAEQAKVKLLIESMLDAPTLLKIVEKVGSPAVGVYYDVMNSQGAGYDIIKEIHMLGKLIGEFHAKDRKGLYGKGEIDFPAVRKAMDDIGYRGWIHTEGAIFPPGLEETCRANAEYLKKVFPPKA